MATAEDEISLDLESVYPENVIKVGKITFGEKKDKIPEKTRKEIQEKIKKERPEKSNKEIDKEIKTSLKKKLQCQTVRLTRAACALLNSGGGVIRAEIENEGYSLEKDTLGLDIRSLEKVINHSDYSEYFDCKQEGSSILIFVKSWSRKSLMYPHVCSLSTGLYKREDSSAMIRDPMNALEFLKSKKAHVIQYSGTKGEPAPKRACLPTSSLSTSNEVGMQKLEALPEAAAKFFEKSELKFDESLEFGESTTVEFKAFPEKEDILKFVESKLPRYVSAFASTKGGLIIFGVDDATKRILGHDQKVEDEELGSAAHKTIMNLLYFHFCTSKEKATYKCKTIPVYDGDEARRGCVLALEIEPFCCVAFLDPPDSWAVKDGKLQRIEASEWCQLMTAEDPDISVLADKFNCELSISNKPPFCKPVYSSKEVDCLEDLQNSLFPVNSNGIIFKPENLCAELFSEHQELENIMKMKTEELQISKGLLIFSRSWAVDVGLQQNPRVACDILLIASGIFPVLFTITEEKNCFYFSLVSLLEYSKKVAYTLKQKLVNEGGYTRRVCVIPEVIALGRKEKGERNLVEYPSAYKVVENGLKEFVQSLVIVLLKFKSVLSDQLGYEFFNLLTIKQFEILNTDFRKTPRLFIYGLPGSGKTIIAKEVIKRIKNVFRCSSNEVLYVCENRPLCDAVRQENICQAVTRYSFLEKDFIDCIYGAEDREIMYTVKHIIIDEAQNFQCVKEEEDWYSKAQTIVPSNGVLWIFLDYLQTTHTVNCGLPPPKKQYPQEWLTVGVRNSTQIYWEMFRLMDSIVKCHRNKLTIPYETLKDLLQKATCGHSQQGFFKKLVEIDEREIVKYIVDKCDSYLRRGYSVENIAVLCNTVTERDRYKPLLEKQMSEMRKSRRNVAFRTLDEAKGNCIVIDSFRRFSGLEKYIVFGILPCSLFWRIADNMVLCVISRANLDCHLLYEM